MTKEQNSRLHEWLLAIFTAIGAALLSSIFLVWLTGKQITSDHTTLVFERQLSTYEELLIQLNDVQKNLRDHDLVGKSSVDRSRLYYTPRMAIALKSGSDTGSFYLTPEAILPTMDRLSRTVEDKSFYIPDILDSQIDVYLKTVAELVLNDPESNQAELLANAHDEYRKTKKMIHEALGVDHIPFKINAQSK